MCPSASSEAGGIFSGPVVKHGRDFVDSGDIPAMEEL